MNFLHLLQRWQAPPRLVFKNEIAGVATIMPIIAAKDVKHPWVAKAAEEYRAARKRPDYGTTSVKHTVRCPGIFGLQRAGWVLRAYQDFTVQTNGDGVSCAWTSPLDQSILLDGGENLISFHPEEMFASYFDTWRADTLRTVIKFNSGWYVRIPKGFMLLEMPVAYSDENRFTVLSGVYSDDMGVATLNPAFLWHELNGTVLVKAGTPIAQYLLVPKDSCEFEIQDKEVNEITLHQLVTQNRFTSDYRFIKDFWEKR
jgi:hypothetical protein